MFNRFSSWNIHVHFVTHLKFCASRYSTVNTSLTSNPYATDFLQRCEQVIIVLIQRDSYKQEIQHLKNGRCVPQNSSIGPFESILRWRWTASCGWSTQQSLRWHYWWKCTPSKIIMHRVWLYVIFTRKFSIRDATSQRALCAQQDIGSSGLNEPSHQRSIIEYCVRNRGVNSNDSIWVTFLRIVLNLHHHFFK